jgi:hypothetical protein
MGFPIPTNTTCDLYHAGNAPPSSPDVAGLAIGLVLRATNLKQDQQYTHWADVALTTDVRQGDTLYVPSQPNGTQFTVTTYERIRFGGGNDFKRAYLKRTLANWPTNDL